MKTRGPGRASSTTTVRAARVTAAEQDEARKAAGIGGESGTLEEARAIATGARSWWPALAAAGLVVAAVWYRWG